MDSENAPCIYKICAGGDRIVYIDCVEESIVFCDDKTFLIQPEYIKVLIL